MYGAHAAHATLLFFTQTDTTDTINQQACTPTELCT